MTDLHLRKERLVNITATEMSAILGVNPYNTGSSVLKNKLNPVAIESIHLRRGHLMEPAVLEALHMDLGWATERHVSGTLVLGPERIAATPDAYTADMKALVECKSIGYKSFERWYKAPPEQYQVQAAVQMMVTGIKKSYIAALEAGDPYDCEWRLLVWEVLHDEELEHIMAREVKRFWDLADEGLSLKATRKVREEVRARLATHHKLIHPEVIPIRSEADEISEILSLFK